MTSRGHGQRSPGRRHGGAALEPTGGWTSAGDMAALRPLAARLSTPEHDVPLVRFGVLAVIGALALAVSGRWATPAAHAGSLVLAVVAMWSFDNVAHEAVHGHLGPPRRNRILGVAASLAVLSPFSLYRAYHLEHHARTATVDDPEGRHVLASRAELLSLPVVGLVFWGGQLVAGARTVVGRAPRYVRTSGQRRAVGVDTASAWVALVALVIGALRSPVVCWGWAVPLAVYLALGQPFFTLYEHFGAEAFALDDAPGVDGVRYPLNLTRTVDTWRPMAWLLSWSNLHAAHHAFPQVPGDHLPELDRATARRSPAALRSRGFVRFLGATWCSLGWQREPAADPAVARALLDR